MRRFIKRENLTKFANLTNRILQEQLMQWQIY